MGGTGGKATELCAGLWPGWGWGWGDGAGFPHASPFAYSDILNSPKLAPELQGVRLGPLLPPTQIQLLEARFLSNEVVSPGPVLGGAEGRWEGIGRVGGLAGSLAATPPWASPYPERAPPPPQATVRKLMARALELESKHWTKDEAPQRLDGRCHSELAIDIIQVALTAPPAPASCLWADVPAAKHTPPYSLSFPRPPLPQP